MDDQPRPAVVSALIAAIDSRTRHETSWMTRTLMRAAWPGGHADRNDRMAAEWVRRWGPARMRGALDDACACAQGRCSLCN